MNIAIQSLGAVGFLFGVIAFQSNQHKTIVRCKLLNEFFFAIQYILLGAITGAVMNGLSCIRNAIFIRNVEKGRSNRIWSVIFIVIIVIYGLFSWTSLISLIPIISKVFTTIAYSLKDTRKVRFLNLPSCIGWLFYNTVYHSMFGVVNEIFSLTSVLIAIVRFDVLKKTK